MISSTLSGVNHLISPSRLNHVSCLRQYLRVLPFMRSTASPSCQMPSKYLNISMNPTVLSAFSFLNGSIRRASSTSPSATIWSTRRFMRSYSSSRGRFSPIFIILKGRYFLSFFLNDVYVFPVCRQISSACITRRGFFLSTVL